MSGLNGSGMMMNPYHNFVASFTKLVAAGRSLPLGNLPPPAKPPLRPDAPAALIFAPHPDDECIIGGLALRLLREGQMRVVNVAVTLGSNRERQQPRLKELQNACDWLGFELETPAPNGLEKINPQTRAAAPGPWNDAVEIIAALLAKHQPQVICFPHEHDWNTTHIGTHLLVMDALKALPATFQTLLAETEFWGQMQSPNLMVELSSNDAADLIGALSFHVGEVRRNPYHLRLPAWMQDNVRRGAELVGGQGGAAPDFQLATLYRLTRWREGRREIFFNGGRMLGADRPATEILRIES